MHRPSPGHMPDRGEVAVAAVAGQRDQGQGQQVEQWRSQGRGACGRMRVFSVWQGRRYRACISEGLCTLDAPWPALPLPRAGVGVEGEREGGGHAP